MKRTNSILYDLILGVGGVITILFLVYAFVSQLIYPNERTYTDFGIEKYTGSWQWITDGGSQAITLPNQLDIDKSVSEITIATTIEFDMPGDRYMTFDSAKQDVYVYVDDELRYSYSTKDTRPFASFSTGIQVFVPLHPWDQGKTLTIVFKGKNNYTGVLDEVLVGSQLGIAFDMVHTQSIQLVCAFMMIILGFLAMVTGFAVKRIYGRTMSLGFAGWGVLFCGIWVMAESNVRQFLVPNFSAFSNMTYLSLIIIPFAFAMYVNALQEKRNQVFYMIIGVLDIVLSFIGVTLQLIVGVDLVNTLGYSFILIIATIVIYLVTVVPDIKKGYVKVYWIEFVGILVLIVSAFMQIWYYSTRPVSMNGNIVCIGLVIMMITSYIRAFKDIIDMEHEYFAAQEASRASIDFLLRMSHEMRTPINAILGMNKMILRECKDNNILEYARDVNGAGNYLLGIVNETLDLARVNSGKIEIEPRDYDLIDMLRECYSLVIPRAKANRLSLVVELDDVLPSRLRGDRQRMVQIITNLLTNAIKYTPAGRITLSIQGKINDGRLMMVISVIDTGIGIKEENIPGIFNSFERISDYRNRNIEGTGLGLAITKQLVELMDGKIAVESVYGKGSTFTVVIPQEIRSIEPCGIFSMGPNGDRRVSNRDEVLTVTGRVLVVDDVEINLKIFDLLLKNTDIELDLAKGGQEALEYLEKYQYDLIFIDHLMPGMDGIKLKEIISSLTDNSNHDIPMIVQTANAVAGAKEQYQAMGFADYISKPIKEEELRALIKKYL